MSIFEYVIGFWNKFTLVKIIRNSQEFAIAF